MLNWFLYKNAKILFSMQNFAAKILLFYELFEKIDFISKKNLSNFENQTSF